MDDDGSDLPDFIDDDSEEEKRPKRGAGKKSA